MKKAFTLIELLVVIAVISVLATMLLPALSEARFLAKMTQCKAGLHNLGIATAMYASDSNSKYPTGSQYNAPMRTPFDSAFFGLELERLACLEDRRVFFCPASKWIDTSWFYSAASYGRSEFLQIGLQYFTQSYFYFGNYSREIYLPAFPRDDTSERKKLFQDSVLEGLPIEVTNHKSPHSLYTDGSVEQGPEDPYELDCYPRVLGYTYWW